MVRPIISILKSYNDINPKIVQFKLTMSNFLKLKASMGLCCATVMFGDKSGELFYTLEKIRTKKPQCQWPIKTLLLKKIDLTIYWNNPNFPPKHYLRILNLLFALQMNFKPLWYKVMWMRFDNNLGSWTCIGIVIVLWAEKTGHLFKKDDCRISGKQRKTVYLIAVSNNTISNIKNNLMLTIRILFFLIHLHNGTTSWT
jgi:hypothetical protein